MTTAMSSNAVSFLKLQLLWLGL